MVCDSSLSQYKGIIGKYLKESGLMPKQFLKNSQ
jgi:hypothetical protein